MLYCIIKNYKSGKCVLICVERTYFLGFSTAYYEVKLFSTKKPIPDRKQLKKIAKEIASNYDDWKKGSSQSGYSHSLILEDYPEYTLAIKEIEKPNLNELNNTNKDDSDNK